MKVSKSSAVKNLMVFVRQRNHKTKRYIDRFVCLVAKCTAFYLTFFRELE
jgi:hypothetical protein